MANVSPGVYTKIIDLSAYVQSVPSTIGFLPIICEHGPDNELIQTNSQDFFYDYGEPNIGYAGKTYGQGPYIAYSFLKESESLYVVRCLPTDAAWSNILVSYNPGSPFIAGDPSATPPIPDTPTVPSSLVNSSYAGLNTKGERSTILDEEANPDNCYMIYGTGRGEWYNNFQIKISKHANPERVGIYILDIYQKQSDPDPITGLAQYEITDAFEVSFDSTQLDNSGESMYIENVVNRYCRHLKCVSNPEACKRALDADFDFSEMFNYGAINIQNGSSGSLIGINGKLAANVPASGIHLPGSAYYDANTHTVLTSAQIATKLLTSAYTGTLPKSDSGDESGDDFNYLYEVMDVDNHYFTIILDGGYPEDVKAAGIYTLVDTRRDCVALVDNGDNATIKAALNKRLNVNTFNTRYMAMYEPYSKIYDQFTGHDIWISPIYHMANIVPYTDNVAEIWYAPAGFNRATIATIKELRFNPLLGDRDRFYLNQINPIVKFNVGYTVWGQLTTQKRPTALQDLNIIRLVLYIKRALEQFCKFYLFELNDKQTWSEVKVEISRFLKQIQNKRGLYSYNVEVSASDYELKSKQFHCDIMLQPVRIVEQILLNFYIK